MSSIPGFNAASLLPATARLRFRNAQPDPGAAKPVPSAPGESSTATPTPVFAPPARTDSVQTTAPVRTQAQKVADRATFDPVDTTGPYEVKRIGGRLATSSAKDGYNGWEEMLKYAFHIENGGDRNDMEVRTYRRWEDSVQGFISGHYLTHEERNLVANAYVYAHDNGIDKKGVEHLYSSMLHQRYGNMFDNGSYEQVYDTDWLTGYREDGRRYIPKATPAHDEAVAMRILSSEAFEDNLIDQKAIRSAVQPSSGPNEYRSTFMEPFEQIVYAYSPSGSDGRARPDAMQSREIQERLRYNAIRAMEAKKADDEFAAGMRFGEMPGEGDNNPFGKPKDLLSERMGALGTTLSESQKNFMNSLYAYAEKNGGEAIMKKVDAMAEAFATSNFIEAFFSPDLPEDATTEDILAAIVWNPPAPKPAAAPPAPPALDVKV